MNIEILKHWIQRIDITRVAYRNARDFYHRARKLLFYLHDARKSWRDMRWLGGAKKDYWVLSSELLFQYHKLEKGLSMPGPKRFFGYDPATAVVDLLGKWRSEGFPTESRIYRGAIATLDSYRERICNTPPENGALLTRRLNAALDGYSDIGRDVVTPMPIEPLMRASDVSVEQLTRLLTARRSVRDFDADRLVPKSLIERAIELAQLSPSACNRQPWRIHAYSERNLIDKLLHHQNGNRGFGHVVPLLLIICSDGRCFFDASERHEPYVDGGLFAMSLMLALQVQGISSCCLNWCVESENDLAVHYLGGLEPAERIVMFMAVGFPQKDSVVPRSPRRPLDDVLTFHSSDAR